MVVERETKTKTKTRLSLVVFHLLLAFLLMALTSLLPSNTTTNNHHHRRRKKKPPPPSPPVLPSPNIPRNSRNTHHSPSSWEQLKSLLSCRSTLSAQVHDPSAARIGRAAACGGSICSSLGDFPVLRRHFPDATSASSAASDCGSVANHETTPLASRSAHRRRHPPHPPHPLRGLSGCYECRAINVEPMHRYPRPRTLCACSECGEVFSKQESLEHHQAIRHAVSELGPEDSGRNIVEIIFKSSWQKKDHPICQIERILKVHNSHRTIARFEAYRDAVKSRYSNPNPKQLQASNPNPNSKNPRAAADGNELLRFHSASLSCRLGFAGSTSLCSSSSSSAASGGTAAVTCGVCAAIRHGVGRANHQHHPLGVRTTASSGRAHDHAGADPGAGGSRAMLVCRVIAGRVRRAEVVDTEEPYDSVAGDGGGAYGNLEELFVANPRAILPCFVVIYRAMMD